MIGNPELDYLSWALNWGLAYDLPNETWIIEHRHEKYPKPLVQRRHRRDLYSRLEIAIDKLVFEMNSISNAKLNVYSTILAWDTMGVNAYCGRCARADSTFLAKEPI